MALSNFRTVIQRAEAGIVKIVSGCNVYIYNTMPDGSAPITTSGVVQANAVLTTIYSDRQGTTVKTNPIISDAQGYIEFFSNQSEFHILCVANDGTRFGLPWVQHLAEVEVDAMAFPTIQAAVDSLGGAAGVVKIPAGSYTSYTVPAFTGVNLGANQGLVGIGKDKTILSLNNPALKNNNLVTVLPDALGRIGGIHIKGITFNGPGIAADSDTQGIGLKLYATDVTYGWISNIIVEDCSFLETAGWGLYIVSENQFQDQITFRDTFFAGARRGGSVQLGKEGGPGANVVLFERCQFNGLTYDTYGSPALERGAVHISHCTNIGFNNCSFQNTDIGPAISFGSISHEISFNQCHFETNTSSGDRAAHWITCASPTGAHKINFNSCSFYKYKTTQGATILKVKSDGYFNGCFSNCHFYSGKTGSVGTDDFILPSASSTPSKLVFNNCITEYGALAITKAASTIQNPAGHIIHHLNSTIKVNVQDYDTFQAAHDALPSTGGIIYVPEGTYSPTTIPAFTGLVISKKNVSIVGPPGNAAILSLPVGYKDTHFFDITIGDHGAHELHNLICDGPNAAATTEELGIGLRVHATAHQDLVVKNVVFRNTGSWAMSIKPPNGSFIGEGYLENVQCLNAKSGGSLRLGDASQPVNSYKFTKCQFNGPPPASATYGSTPVQRGSVHINTCYSVLFDRCSFQDQSCATAVSFTGDTRDIKFSACHFETNQLNGTNNDHWITVGTGAIVYHVVFDTCSFLRLGATDQGVKLIKTDSAGNIDDWVFSDCDVWFSKTADDATDDFDIGSVGGTGIQVIRCTRKHASLAEKQFAVTGTGASIVSFVHHPNKVLIATHGSAYTPKCNSGDTIELTITGNMTINAPTIPQRGDKLQFVIIQDGVGGYTVAWNAIFKFSTAWSNTGNTANKKSLISFYFNGTDWVQLTPQLAYF